MRLGCSMFIILKEMVLIMIKIDLLLIYIMFWFFNINDIYFIDLFFVVYIFFYSIFIDIIFRKGVKLFLL